MTVEEIEKYLLLHKKKYYLKSFVRKAKKIIVDFVPLDKIPEAYNFYRKTIKKAQSATTYLPTTLDTDGSSVANNLPEIDIYGLQEVYFCTDATAFLTKSGKEFYYEKVRDFSADYTILYNTFNLHFHSHQLVRLSNLPKVERQEEVLFLAGTFRTNYFHFLIEILSKTEFIDQIPNFEKLIVVVDVSAQKNANFKTLLSFFIKNNKIEYLEEDHFYSFSKVWHITNPHTIVPNIEEGEKYQADFTVFSKQSVEYVRNICLQNYDIQQVKVKAISKIFLARKSTFRKYNESDLLKVAKNYGFEAVFLEDCNVHEQIFYVRNADYIIGPSGAAWTNLIFCEENKTKGLMWLGEVWGDFSVFSTLAKYVNFDLYNYRFYQENATFHSNYELSLSEFEEQLKKLLLK